MIRNRKLTIQSSMISLNFYYRLRNFLADCLLLFFIFLRLFIQPSKKKKCYTYFSSIGKVIFLILEISIDASEQKEI